MSVALYQQAGSDFSAETCSLVVKAAVALQQPQLAAQCFTRTPEKNRLPAWLTKRSAAQLVRALAALPEDAGVAPAVQVLQAVEKKGVAVAQAALQLAMQQQEKDKDAEEVLQRVQSIAQQVLRK